MEPMDDQRVLSYQNLLAEFENTKKQLGETEENLKRITGRDPQTFNNAVPGGPKWKNQIGGAPMFRQAPFPIRKRPLFPIVKKPKDGEEDEEEEEGALPDDSEDEEMPAKRPSIASTVVARPKDLKSRKETIQGQNVNPKVKARNRRMFGMILGTLQKFQHEAVKHKDKEQRRAEIEQKLEAAETEEKERMKKEKEELFLSRKEKQIKLRCLEKKIEIAEMHEVWEKNQKYSLNFICTRAEPKIYYLPVLHNQESLKKLDESKMIILEKVQERRLKMERELLEVEESYKREPFPQDKENIGPVEGEEVEGEKTLDETANQEAEENSTEAVMEEGGAPEEVEAAAMELENTMEVVNTEEGPRTAEEEEENTCEQEFEPIYD